MKKGDRVLTPDGPGTVIAPWKSRGLSRHGGLWEESWIVVLDEHAGQWRKIYWPRELRPLNEAKA